MPRRLLLVVAMVGLVTIAGCQADPGVDMGELEGGPEDASRLAEQFRDNTSSYQAEVLADGEVSQAEKDQAVAATLSCIRDEGFEVEYDTDGSRSGSGSFSARSDANEAERLAEVQDSCLAKYYNEIEIVWSTSQIPTDPEQRREDMANFRTCLEDAGLNVPEQLTAESLQKVLPLREVVRDGETEREVTDDEQFAAVEVCREQYGYLLR